MLTAGAGRQHSRRSHDVEVVEPAGPARILRVELGPVVVAREELVDGGEVSYDARLDDVRIDGAPGELLAADDDAELDLTERVAALADGADLEVDYATRVPVGSRDEAIRRTASLRRGLSREVMRGMKIERPLTSTLDVGFVRCRGRCICRKLEKHLVLPDHAQLRAGALLDRLDALLEVPDFGVERFVACFELHIDLALRRDLGVELAQLEPPSFAKPHRILQRDDQQHEDDGEDAHVATATSIGGMRCARDIAPRHPGPRGRARNADLLEISEKAVPLRGHDGAFGLGRDAGADYDPFHLARAVVELTRPRDGLLVLRRTLRLRL